MTQVLGLSRYYPTTYRILCALAPVLCMLSTNHHFPDPNLIYTPLRKESTDVSNTIHFTQNPSHRPTGQTAQWGKHVVYKNEDQSSDF